MATKKTETPVETPPIVEPVAPAPEPAPAPAPAAPQYHELSEDEARRVNLIKGHFTIAVNYLKRLRDSVHDAEVQRMYSVAITEAETASMWAVKAATYRG